MPMGQETGNEGCIPHMANISCDVAIIGAGTAGLAAERAARRQGARTLLIDPAFDGTTCTNVGCMPSKLLIAAGNAARAATHAALFGIDCAVRVDEAKVFARLQHERDGFIAGVRRSLESLPADVMHKGRARFLGPTTIGVDDGTIVDAGAVVVASGARPSVPDFLHGLEQRVLTNEILFDLKALPPSLAVIGAGPLGLELAQALARLGDRELTASEILTLPFYHPSFEEGLKHALREICSRTGGPVAMERDDGFLAGA